MKEHLGSRVVDWVLVLCVGALLVGLTTEHTADAQALPTATGPGAYVTVGGTYSHFQAD